MKKYFIAVMLAAIALPLMAAEETGNIDGWSKGVVEIKYLSSADNTMQPALYYDPGKSEAVPLLVALHTWSGDYKQKEVAYAKWCIKKGWVMIHPDFRGANNRPEAMGSELVVKDIISAVDYARQHSKIDPSRIYVIGSSGGGYATLLMAGRAKDIWAAASAWVPIYDLKQWHKECVLGKRGYDKSMEKSCGGAPGISPEVDRQYAVRSACSYLQNASEIPLDINTGIHDGHKGSVPVSQSLKAFNALAKTEDRLSDADITFITDNAQIPDNLKMSVNDQLYSNSKRPVLFRRVSGNARITVFDGGHDIIREAGLAWLEKQRKGTAPEWNIATQDKAVIKDANVESGK
jgi:acetyl esterase/lipase